MRYLTIEEVIYINMFILAKNSPKELIGSGIKDINSLASAVKRPQQTLLEKDAYPRLTEKASALVQSLAQNHPFHNGNKRTALLSLLQFLQYNGHEFTMDGQKAREDFIVDIVEKKLSLPEINEIITRNSAIL